MKTIRELHDDAEEIQRRIAALISDLGKLQQASIQAGDNAAIKLGDKMRTIRRTDDPYTGAKVAKGTVFVVAGIDVDPADGDELIVYGRTVNGLWCWLRPADLEVVKEDGE